MNLRDVGDDRLDHLGSALDLQADHRHRVPF